MQTFMRIIVFVPLILSIIWTIITVKKMKIKNVQKKLPWYKKDIFWVCVFAIFMLAQVILCWNTRF